MKKIDCQSHYVPEEFLKRLMNRREYPKVEVRDGEYFWWFKEGQGIPITKKMYDLEEKLKDMDSCGVDMQVLSMVMPGMDLFEPDLGLELCGLVNDEMANLEKKHPGHFPGLATLPLQDMDKALGEMERAVGKLGLKGVCIHSNVRGKFLGEMEFWPLYKRAEELDIPVFLHPTIPVMGEIMVKYGFQYMVGFLFDTTLTVLTLIFNGVLEEYPNFKLVLPHLGSTIPYLMGRIDHEASTGWVVKKERITKSPSEYFKKIYLDTVSNLPLAFPLAIGLNGVDKLLYASDHPFWELKPSIAIIEGLQIPERDKEKIFGENAKKLLKI